MAIRSRSSSPNVRRQTSKYGIGPYNAVASDSWIRDLLDVALAVGVKKFPIRCSRERSKPLSMIS